MNISNRADNGLELIRMGFDRLFSIDFPIDFSIEFSIDFSIKIFNRLIDSSIDFDKLERGGWGQRVPVKAGGVSARRGNALGWLAGTGELGLYQIKSTHTERRAK